MSISKQTFETLQSLAAVDFDEDEARSMRRHLELMLEWFAELPPLAPIGSTGVAAAETCGVDGGEAAAVHPAELRADVVSASLRCSEILRNAPDAQDGCYGVPRLQDRDP